MSKFDASKNYTMRLNKTFLSVLGLFASLSAYAYGISKALATSLITILADIVPNVII